MTPRTAFRIALTLCAVVYLSVGGMLLRPQWAPFLEPLAYGSMVGAVLCMVPMGLHLYTLLRGRQRHER